MSNTVSSDSAAQDQLRAFIERIERMEEEKKAIADDIREIYAEAKGNGFNTKVLRRIIALRKQDHAERMEEEALLDLYMAALGMQAAPREDDEPSGLRQALADLQSVADKNGSTLSMSVGGGPVVVIAEPRRRRRRPPTIADGVGFERGEDV